MIPLGDDNPTRSTPIVTYALIAINVLVYLWQQTFSDEELFRMFLNDSVVPRLVSNDIFSIQTFLDLNRSMFFHGGITHIGGNMLYLYIFGDNVEDRFGKPLFILFYFISGYVASLAQVAIDPDSTIPLIGASGAISGVLGGYLLLYPGARVRVLILFGYFARATMLSASLVLGFYFVLQVFNGAIGLGAEAGGGGVAYFAHIGGFVAGVVLTIALRFITPEPSPPTPPRSSVDYWDYPGAA